METKTRCTSRFAATVLITINIIAMLLCIILFSFSLWIITSPDTLSAAIQNKGTPIMKVLFSPQQLSVQFGVAIAVLIIFITFVAFMGCYGAVNRSQFLLFMYSVLVLLLLLLECALIFYFSSNLIEKGPQESDGQWTHTIRLMFRCCEHNNTVIPSQEVSQTLPWSCCGLKYHPNNCTVSNTFDQDCQIAVRNWMERNQAAIYVPLTILHVILASCSLVRRSCSASQSYT